MKRQGGSFPPFTRDPVVQFCVEEALLTLVDVHDIRDRQQDARDAAVAEAQRAVADRMAKLQGRS